MREEAMVQHYLFTPKSKFPEALFMFFNLLLIAYSILNIFAIFDVMKSNRDWATKVVLLAIILTIPFVGAGLYLFAFRDKSNS